jgi:hypothetical protein
MRCRAFLALAAVLAAAACGDSGNGADADADACTGDACGETAGDDGGRDGADADADADFEWTDAPDVPHEYLWGAQPPSTLLPPGTTELAFSVNSTSNASCGWSLGADVPYESMTAFETGQGTTAHATTFRGLDPDTTVVNELRVRCDSQPDFVLLLQYRDLPDANPSFPRTGNLWGWWGLYDDGLPHCARIDLYLGADFDPEDSRTLRGLNPDILILTSINTVERTGDDEVPDDYWLRDTNGNRIEVWNDAYRLNLTRLDVAEWQARYAYQRILDAGLLIDGCFFDNFFTSQSWLTHDMWGNEVHLDANGDTVEDDPAWLDAAWRAGVFHELEAWRQLMPHALASGHLPRPPTAEFGALYNGDSIGFLTADAIEGKTGFATLWDAYHGWWTVGRAPIITMIESTPPDQIAYGYGYRPMDAIPASTLEFARTYYPNVRFGLATTLMNDGYFAHEFGDTRHGQDWWYDELDFDLGHARGAAQRVTLGSTDPTDRMINGGFEDPLDGTWGHWANATAGAVATFAQDTTVAAEGSTSARVDVTDAGEGVDWHVSLYQSDRSLVAGTVYDLVFQARAAAPHPIAVNAQKQVDDWRSYGLWREFALDTEWRTYTATFEASETATDARIGFQVGAQTGTVWLDDVHLRVHPADVFRREFDNGLVLLNGSREAQTVDVGPGFSRITGDEAARHEYIVDDADAAFGATAEWTAATYDSGEWVAAGPWYHDWKDGCHRLDGTTGEATFDLGLPSDDTYSIDVWWAAAPEAAGWSTRVVFEVVDGGGTVRAAATLDQTAGGDEWHRVADVALSRTDAPVLRVRNLGPGAAVADAVYLRSAARYNDGSASPTVTLAPMDGIVLRRTPP